MAYDYMEAIKNDVMDYIENDATIDADDIIYNRDELIARLYDEMFVDDSITGNASGSYTFNTWEAEENLCGNWDLLEEALENFSYAEDPGEYIDREGFEAADVTIRCHLLGQVLDDAVYEIEDALDAMLEDERDAIA